MPHVYLSTIAGLKYFFCPRDLFNQLNADPREMTAHINEQSPYPWDYAFLLCFEGTGPLSPEAYWPIGYIGDDERETALSRFYPYEKFHKIKPSSRDSVLIGLHIYFTLSPTKHRLHVLTEHGRHKVYVTAEFIRLDLPLQIECINRQFGSWHRAMLFSEEMHFPSWEFVPAGHKTSVLRAHMQIAPQSANKEPLDDDH